MGVGVGTSPLLYRVLLILLCDEDTGGKSFLVALDRRTGKEAWRVPRKIEVSWATPVIVKAAGRDELVTAGNQLIQAYDPATGRELWRMKGLESNAVTTPLVGDGVVVVSSGYPSKVTIAVKPGGSGDVTDTPQDTFVVKAGPRFEVVGTNPLGEPIGASAAAAGGRLYIRGEKHLFAITAPAGS